MVVCCNDIKIKKKIKIIEQGVTDANFSYLCVNDRVSYRHTCAVLSHHNQYPRELKEKSQIA